MNNVEVYGGYHSPWVQAVLLGLHDRKIPYTLTTVPPWPAFRQWGVLMPVARIDGGEWMRESGEILRALGWDLVSHDDRNEISRAWQGVLHRTDNPFRFFNRFSLAGDRHPDFLVRTLRNFFRSFVPFYMFLLISFSRISNRMPDPGSFCDQFLPIEERLAASPDTYLAGKQPGTLDLMLFGIFQCHCSIEVPPVRVVQQDPRLERLREWLAAMQMRFADYPYMYSGVYFKPRSAAPVAAGLFDRGIFFLGLATMFTAFPVTVPLMIILFRKVPRPGPGR